MVAVPLEVEVVNQQLIQELEVLERRLSPIGMSGFLQGQVGPYLQMRAKARFGNEGDSASGAWAPLKLATTLIRESEGFPGSHPINIRTGELEAYITAGPGVAWPTGLGATLQYPSQLPKDEETLTKLETAQAGRSNPRTVARPVLAVDMTDMLHVTSQIAFYVMAPAAGWSTV